jgi:hypothetical protein
MSLWEVVPKFLSKQRADESLLNRRSQLLPQSPRLVLREGRQDLTQIQKPMVPSKAIEPVIQ